MGSPPHTRGKLWTPGEASRFWRITPAYAGKTIWRRRACTRTRDHPRIRGENIGQVKKITPAQGSPPHTRGKLCRRPRGRPEARFTPAYAGKTEAHCKTCINDWDHPRIRGENPVVEDDGYGAWGSPPHTRGKQPPTRHPAGLSRITPAYAGKTWRK